MLKSTGYEGERLSFFEIFSKKNYKVIIPILQRDYAQGRMNDEINEVRNEFLEALYCYLDEKKPNRDLDFVYGTLEQDLEDKHLHFIPLDGQQRLTTLFLLHWFLSQISENEAAKEEFRSKLMCGSKSLFTYETRQSSAEFCDALMSSEINMKDLKTLTVEGKEIASLSATLTNESWFFRSWLKDPTIKSMLVMLDAIYNKFIQRKDFFELLTKEEPPIITFVFMDLKTYKLNDELYIKMNSRGKPLTRFENFKAKLEKFLKDLNPKISRKFRLRFSNGEKEVSLKEYFSYNIDTKWTNLVWQSCKYGKQHFLDSYLENLFRVLITNYFASIAKSKNKEYSHNVFDVLMNSKNLSFSVYESIKILSYDSVLSIVESLDALCIANKKLISDSYKFYYDEEEIFAKACENTLSRSDRLRFFAYTQYIIRHKENLNGLDQWMRVIHNLTHPENTITDDDDSFSRAINSIDKLLNFAPNIIGYLQNSTIEDIFKRQGKEECIKASLFAHKGWQELIEEVEKHSYFNGQIGFLLEFSGICTYDKDHSNLQWSAKEDVAFKKIFIRYSNIAKYIFETDEEKNRVHDSDYCFERAVLAQGDYLLPASNSRYNLLSKDIVKNNIRRDFSWKRLLRINTGENLHQIRNLVKITFDKIEDVTDIERSLLKLCKPLTEDRWRNNLISSPDLIDVCSQGFIYHDSDVIHLLGESQLNHFHYELFTYHLWMNKFLSGTLTVNGFNSKYLPQKCSGIIPHIELDNFFIRKREYKIEIYSLLDEQSKDFRAFQLIFQFKNEDKFDYPVEVVEAVRALNFKEEDSVNGFIWECRSENSVLKKVEGLAETLTEIKERIKFKRKI